MLPKTQRRAKDPLLRAPEANRGTDAGHAQQGFQQLRRQRLAVLLCQSPEAILGRRPAATSRGWGDMERKEGFVARKIIDPLVSCCRLLLKMAQSK